MSTGYYFIQCKICQLLPDSQPDFKSNNEWRSRKKYNNWNLLIFIKKIYIYLRKIECDN